MNLRKTARRNARLQYGPQLREIRQLKGEARQMLRTGTRQERQAARGIIAAADNALHGVRRDYRRAGEETRMVNRMAGSGPSSNNIFAQAEALSRRQTKRGISEAIARELGDLRARMVRAKEAQAYGTRALRGQYQSTLSGLQKQRGEVRRDMGAFALSELGRLQQEQADAAAEAQKLALEERRVQATEGSLRLRQQQAREKKAGSSSGSKDSVHSQNIKDDIITLRAEYERRISRGDPLHKIAKMARKKGWGESVINAASSLATKGYIPGNGVRELRQIGVRVPRVWQTPRAGRGGGLNAVQGIRG